MKKLIKSAIILLFSLIPFLLINKPVKAQTLLCYWDVTTCKQNAGSDPCSFYDSTSCYAAKSCGSAPLSCYWDATGICRQTSGSNPCSYFNQLECTTSNITCSNTAPTATPVQPGNCFCDLVNGSCLPQQGPGYCNQGAGYLPICTPLGGGCSCTCDIPTPTSAAPTSNPQWAVDCNSYNGGNNICPDASYANISCINHTQADNLGCARPPSDPYGNYNCNIEGVVGGAANGDCWCCPQVVLITYPLTPMENMSPRCGQFGVNTAVGCIPLGDQNTFLKFVLGWAIGIAGGISLLLLIYSGFLIMTAAGDKRKLQSGKELLTAALAGIMLIVFSVFVLDFIGIRVFRIPGL